MNRSNGRLSFNALIDPVPPRPHGAGVVALVAVGVGVAGGVEPLPDHPLAVARARRAAGRRPSRKRPATCRRGRRPPPPASAGARSGRASPGGCSVALSASGDGFSPSFSSFARMNRSIGLRGQAASFTGGSSGALGGTNAQCVPHFAPCSTHALSVATCAGEMCRLLLGGGMTSSGSSDVIRRTSSLSAGLPGTTTVTSSFTRNIPSFVSRRSFALRAFCVGAVTVVAVVRQDRQHVPAVIHGRGARGRRRTGGRGRAGGAN